MEDSVPRPISLDERVETAPNEYASSFLRELERLARQQRRHVLDLGRPSGENVSFLAGLGCKVSIADFYGGLEEAGAELRRNPDHFAAACSEILRFREDERFDAVLAWDLFNYLSLDEIGIFAERLRPHLPPGAMIMTLVSIYQRVPDRPFRCLALAGGRVRYESTVAVQRPCPRHQEPSLIGRLGDFRVETSLLLKGGMREYGFIRRSPAS